MTTLTQEQIDGLNYQECQAALVRLSATYPMNQPISELDPAVWLEVDAIVNTLLWLEDRCARFEDVRIPSMDPGQIVFKPAAPAVKKPVGRPARQFRIDEKVYTDIHEAARRTGIKTQTLKTYVSRKPERYSYVD